MSAGKGNNGEPEKKPRRRVKKVAGHGGHHGGAWKVAYADLVTAMMALFLVLWLVSQADTKLKESLANYFRSPGVFDHIRGGILKGSQTVDKEQDVDAELQTLTAAALSLQNSFKSKPEFESVGDRVKVEVTDEGLRIQIIDQADDVSFDSGSAELKADAQAILVEIAQGICQLPNLIYISGHTDRHVFPAGSTYTNWELSADRANAARRVLESNCVKASQIRRVIGHADTDLLVPDDPFAPANRRISITVSRLSANDKKTKMLKVKPDVFGGQRLGKTDEEKLEEAESHGDQAAHAKTPAGDSHHETEGETAPAKPLLRPQAKGTETENHGAAGKTEKRLQETKLWHQGNVSVGQPDKLPAGAKFSRAH